MSNRKSKDLTSVLKRFGFNESEIIGLLNARNDSTIGFALLESIVPKDKKELVKRVLKDRIALSVSRFRDVHHVQKGNPDRSHEVTNWIPVGSGVSVSPNVDTELLRALHAGRRDIAPANYFPPAVMTYPLNEVYEDTRDNWHNRYDDVGKRGTRHRYGSPSTAVVPYDPVYAESVTHEKENKENAEREEERKKKDESWRRYNLSAKEKFLEDKTKEFGSRSRAEDAYKKELRKGLPTFFKNSKASTKTLERMSRAFGAMKGIPGLGRIASAGPVGAGVALGMAVSGAILSFLGKSDSANAKYVGWKNAHNYYGVPDQKAMKLMALAGISDPSKQAETYAKLSMNFGSFENALSVFSKFQNMPKGIGRNFVLQSMSQYGLTPETLKLADIAENGLPVVDKARLVNANKAFVDINEVLAEKSGSDVDPLEQAWRYIRSNSAAARGFDKGFWEPVLIGSARAAAAAESADEYEASKGTNRDSGDVSVVNNISIDKDGNVSIDTDVERNGGSLRRTANVDHISAGVTQ